MDRRGCHTVRLLDLFCGAGGCSAGYSIAGFEVVGVDIKPQKNYPFEFHCADAFAFLEKHGHEFDVIHCSPPCQGFSDLKNMHNAKPHADLLSPMRDALRRLGQPYVIENVEGAPMHRYLVLCGTMFDLGTAQAELRRHRRFETFPYIAQVEPCRHGRKGRVIGVYGGHGRDRRRTFNTQDFSMDERREAMGIDWMNGNELSQAVPPKYTEWIGKRMIDAAGVSLTKEVVE